MSAAFFLYHCSPHRLVQVSALLVSLLVIGINLYFSTDTILSAFSADWYVFLLMAGPVLFYLGLVLYLLLTCLQVMGLAPPLFSAVSAVLIRRMSVVFVGRTAARPPRPAVREATLGLGCGRQHQLRQHRVHLTSAEILVQFSPSTCSCHNGDICKVITYYLAQRL